MLGLSSVYADSVPIFVICNLDEFADFVSYGYFWRIFSFVDL